MKITTDSSDNTSFFGLNQSIKNIAHDFAIIIADNLRNGDEINKLATVSIPGRQKPITIKLHRTGTSVAGCYDVQTNTFNLTADGLKVLSDREYITFNQLVTQLSSFLDKLINQNVNNKIRETNFMGIEEAILNKDDRKLEALASGLNISAGKIPGYANLLSIILDRLFSNNRITTETEQDTFADFNKEQLEEAAVMLLDKGAIPLHYSPMQEAIKTGCTKLVEALINNGFEFETKYSCKVGEGMLGNLLDLAIVHDQKEIEGILTTKLKMQPTIKYNVTAAA